MQLLDVRPRQVKLGFSALKESLRGIEVFLNPSHHAEQLPWVRTARRRLSRPLKEKIEEFRFFFEPGVETFALAWPEQSQASFQEELTALRGDPSRYRDAVVKRLSGSRLFTAQDMAKYRRPGWYRGAAAEFSARHPQSSVMLRRFVESPERNLKAFCEAVEMFYAQAVEHYWGAIAAQLAADIAMRRQILREHGLPALMRTLSREIGVTITSRGVNLHCPDSDTELHFGEHGSLLLTPSFFCWPHLEVFSQKTPSGPRTTIAYPLPTLLTRSQPLADGKAVVEASKALADPVRLRIVELLRSRDLSTRELAGFMRISEPIASKHLKKLVHAGLVRTQRSGYFVMYGLQRDAIKRLATAFSSLQ